MLIKNENNSGQKLNAIGRWGYLVDVMLKRHSIFNIPAIKKANITRRWSKLVEGMAFKLGNKKLWLGLDHMVNMDNIERRVKQRRIAVLGRWSKLINGV